MSGWSTSDAIVLTCLGVRGWRSLDSLFYEQDYLNRAWLGRGATEVAIGRLIGSGLLEADGARSRLTKAGRGLMRRRKGRGADQVGRVLSLLEGVPLDAVHFAFSDEDWQAGWETFRRRAGWDQPDSAPA